MPIIFIHGVSVRDTDQNYKKDFAARDDLFKTHVIKRLAVKDSRFQGMDIVNSYWGKDGVTFAWKLASLPRVSFLEDLGVKEGQTPESDFEIAQTIEELSEIGRNDAFRKAAEKDLTRFVEAVISPVLLSEMHIVKSATVAPEDEGVLQSLLATAAFDVSSDPIVQGEVKQLSSDKELMDFLKSKIKQRFEQLARDRLVPTPVVAGDKQTEILGAKELLIDSVAFVGELFDRAADAPRRAATTPMLAVQRRKLHYKLSLFNGDIFVYLAKRGDRVKKGPIIETVLYDIANAPRHSPNEPTIVVTHSMGGNILYDILTYYDTDLKIDFWASVGGQVAQFEEMKIFQASNESLKAPNKVNGLKSRVGYWLNVYDAVDLLSFMAKPVFADVDADEKYDTGAGDLKSHSEYFGRASFYQLLRHHIEKALSR